MGFARERRHGELAEGELVYHENQLHRILNLDESTVSLDGTTELAGGSPTTKFESTNKNLPRGADRSHKSSYKFLLLEEVLLQGVHFHHIFN